MSTLERVNLVTKTVVSIGTVLGMCAGLWLALNHGAQAAQKADVAQINLRDDSQDQRIDRLISVVEINSTLMIEPKGSEQYVAAVAKLRSMRRVVNN